MNAGAEILGVLVKEIEDRKGIFLSLRIRKYSKYFRSMKTKTYKYQELIT